MIESFDSKYKFNFIKFSRLTTYFSSNIIHMHALNKLMSFNYLQEMNMLVKYNLNIDSTDINNLPDIFSITHFIKYAIDPININNISDNHFLLLTDNEYVVACLIIEVIIPNIKFKRNNEIETISNNNKNLYISGLGVHPKYRNQQLCKNMLTFLTQHYQKINNSITLYLEVDITNIIAIKCYKKSGFDFNNLYYNTENRNKYIVMSKDITSII